jgi:serine/threonine protein phosphatase PrpC
MNILIGISEDIGWRERMEDEHAIYQIPEKNFFSAEIYDGHAGRRAAQVAAEMLTPHFLHAWSRESDKSLKEQSHEYELLRDAYRIVDDYIVKSGIESGTAAANFYIIDDRFIAANVGDTRIIIGTAHGAFALTVDHKPHLPEEKSRIESLGGKVIFYDVPRVQGMLAMSRALGDASLKPYVSCEPRIIVGYLGKENDYAILACDGVWDVLIPQEVLELVRKAESPQKAAELVKEKAIDKGSTDNITVIVLDLRGYTRNLKRDAMEILEVIDKAVKNSKQ